MAASGVQLCVKHTFLLPPLKKVATTTCAQVRHCRTVLRPPQLPNVTGTPTKHQQRQHIRFYSDVLAKHEENKEDANQLIHIKNAVPLNESPASLDLDAATGSYALEEISDEEAVRLTPRPSIPPVAASLRDYVDRSETLAKLVHLGVNLWKLEERPNVGSMLLRLNFDTDVAPRLLFLKALGVDESRLGFVVTRNPFVLTEDLQNLHARVNYLKSKKFTSENVASMVSRAPYLLNFTVKRLDNRLGFYQQQLGLSASNTRNIVARLPRLLCGSLEPVKENLKVCEIELGFKANEIQHIVSAVPKILTANKRKLTQIFDFLHNTMKVPHHLIVKFPQVFNTKFLRMRERHLFLEYLGRAQYNPDQANYVSLERLTSSPDEIFCTEVALAMQEDFFLFQKTL
ncbi:transcription termination factor 3, mitochondrial isoform X2 [Phyllopteryx taeniolatus]|nr:transcription termination factor 3, mitochondrial isoform X2 [Phyllopteryx taeniolatus]XP_061615254.1 transcription termination factor 3, mitochondrial isoform X2 [Phyllopteryx taeniolatus]